MKLHYRSTMLIGLAFLSITAFWAVYDSVIPLILENNFAFDKTTTGAIMALDNVLALFLLPFFGARSDKCRSRFGRRMPFIVVGTVLSATFVVLLPLAATQRSLPLFIIALGAVLLSMSIYRSPAVALMPDITPKPLRSKANAIINLMGTFGGILALAFVALLVPKTDDPSYIPLFAALSVLMLVSVLILVFFAREPALTRRMQAESREWGIEEEDTEENGNAPLSAGARRSLIFILLSIFLWFMGYNGVSTAFSRYAQHFWGLEGGDFSYALIVAQIAAVITFLPVAMLATRIGRRKTILMGTLVLALCFAVCTFFSTFSAAIYVLFALAGIGWATINVNSYPMVVEMSKGSNVGKYTGLYYTSSMAAQIVTPILSGALLDRFGYGVLFPYSAVFVLLSFITMFQVRHGDSRPAAAKSKLEAFDAAD